MLERDDERDYDRDYDRGYGDLQHYFAILPFYSCLCVNAEDARDDYGGGFDGGDDFGGGDFF